MDCVALEGCLSQDGGLHRPADALRSHQVGCACQFVEEVCDHYLHAKEQVVVSDLSILQSS